MQRTTRTTGTAQMPDSTMKRFLRIATILNRNTGKPPERISKKCLVRVFIAIPSKTTHYRSCKRRFTGCVVIFCFFIDISIFAGKSYCEIPKLVYT
jgi:hypothetical protein